MIQLYKGDCLEVMKNIPAGSIDAIICDPPYGTTACKWDSVIPFDAMWEQLNRVIKPNGAVVLFGSEPFSSALRMSNIKNYKYDWVWDKLVGGNFLNAKKQPLRRLENICIFYRKQPTYNPQLSKKEVSKIREFNNSKRKGYKGGYIGKTNGKCSSDYDIEKSYPVNIVEYNSTSGACNSKYRVHPTQKPVPLMEYLIKTYTNEGETVLDFTMGSGTTLVACQNTKRKGIGIEQDDKYFNIAQERTTANRQRLSQLLF